MGWIFIPRPQQFSMSLTPHQSLSPCKAKVSILDRLSLRLDGKNTRRTHSTIIRRTPRIRKHLEERRAPIRRPRIGNLTHINIHRPPMRASNCRRLQRRKSAGPVAGLLVHLDGHGVAGFDGAATRDGAAVDVAADVVGGDVCEGVVGGGHADAGLALVDAVDPEVLEGGVGGDLGC
jgi:hypothetical protein